LNTEDIILTRSGVTDILDAELKKAAEFPAFLKSLDSGDDATKILIEGSKRVLFTLGMVEKGANFLANVPMEKILDMYERCETFGSASDRGSRRIASNLARNA
jgi:hypothetical protein